MLGTRLLRCVVPAAAVALAFVAIASAGWAGKDPASNFPVRKLPFACQTAPTGTVCINAAVYYLDKARAKLGQPPYALPADFPALSAAQQMLILTNLDRIQYGLQPITGLTDGLNHDAYAKGVKSEADPAPSDPTGEIAGYTSNWAGGYPNAPLAYEGWMYADGLGSANLDCSATHKAGCWGHRHNILWAFDKTDVLAMGAASGPSPDGASYALMLVAGFPADADWGDPGYTPTYSYLWSDAVADGAGTNAYDPGVPDTTTCNVPDVIGRSYTAARKLIAASHCAVGRVVHRAAAHRGPQAVVDQRPAQGAQLAPGSKIRLTVGRPNHRWRS